MFIFCVYFAFILHLFCLCFAFVLHLVFALVFASEAANLDVFFFLDFGHFLVLLET